MDLLVRARAEVGLELAAQVEQVGAPGLDTARVLARLRAATIPGVEFTGVSFTPRSPGDDKFPDTRLRGIRLTVTDRGRYDPTATALWLLAAVQGHGASTSVWPASKDQISRLLGNDPGPLVGLDTARVRSLLTDWARARDNFLLRRRPYLIYPD